MANTDTWSRGPDHRDGCLRCGGETKVVQTAPFNESLDCQFYGCVSCDYTVGILRKRRTTTEPPFEVEKWSERCQREADEADEAYARSLGEPGRCLCDPVY